MTFFDKVRFLWWYAFRDLLIRGARLTTLVNASTVAVLLAFILVVYGLALGFGKMREDSLRRDPLVLCQWLESKIRGQSLREEDLRRLRAELPQRIHAPGWAVPCYLFYNRDLDWGKVVDGRATKDPLPMPGRTLAPDDPLLKSCHFYPGGGMFASADEEAVILTKAAFLTLLQARSIEEAILPQDGMLMVRIPGSNRFKPVRIAGVLTNSLPLGHQFIILERFYLNLLTEYEVATGVYSGPLPPGWETPEIRKNIEDYVDRKDLILKVRSGVWRLTQRSKNGEAPRKLDDLEWAAHLETIRDLISNQLRDGIRETALEKAFIDLRALDHPEKVNRLPEGHPFAGLYLRDLSDARPVANALPDLGVSLLDEDVINRFEGIQKTSNLLLVLLGIIVSIITVQTLWNMMVIQQQRAQHKVAEIGMLKAMGMSNALMRQVYLTEAFLLWFLGAVLGLGAVELTERFLPILLTEDPELRDLSIRLPWWPQRIGVLALSLLLCMVTTIAATSFARRASPAKSLSRE